MREKNKLFKRIFSLTMALVMLLPSQAVAYYLAEELSSLEGETIALQDGTSLALSETDTWESLYPQGIFAISEANVLLDEGDEATITVYRLGGSDGKAVAYFGYEPTIYAEEDGVTPDYSMAISDEDIALSVEQDQPMAAYQSIGGGLKTSAAIITQSQAVAVVENEETLYEITLSAPGDLAYDDIQWYAYTPSENIDFEKIVDATAQTLVVLDTDLESHDFRFTYTVEGITYVSTSTDGVVYEEIQDYQGDIPDDIPLWAEQSFLPLIMDDADPYSGYAFAMTFAQGEHVKELKLSTLDDDLVEALESATLTLYYSDGAEIFTGAEKLIVSIQDDEVAQPSQIAIDIDAITVDKSEGTATIPVVRTGGTSTALSVDYKTVDGTAVAGKDYTATTGTLLFYAGIDAIDVQVELIDDKIQTNDTVDFTVEISNLLGDGAVPSTIGNDTATVSLYNSNTATEENFATMLYDGTVDDVSAHISQATAAAPVGETIITGTQNAIDSGATAMADYQFAWNQNSIDTFAVTESNLGTAGQWVETTMRLGYNAATTTEGVGWFYNVDYIDYTTMVKLGGEFGFGGDTITLDNDPTKYQYYDQLRLTGEFTTGYKSKGITSDWGTDAVTQPYINVTSTSGNVATYAGSTETNKTHSTSFSASLDLGYDGYNSYTTITAGQNSLKGTTLEDESSSFWYIMNLNRREFTNTDNFKIVTSNDANTAPAGAAVLSSATYNALVPTFSLDAGGFGNTGKLFAGSQIGVTRSAQAGTFYKAGLCTYSTAAQGMYDWADTIDTTYYIDTMDKINSTYTHYYVLDRKQTVQVDLQNSMDADAYTADAAATMAAARTDFENNTTLLFGVTDLQAGYSQAFNKNGEYYDDNPFTTDPRNQEWRTDGESGTYLYDYDIFNLQYIFFHSDDPKDMITVNGKGYVSGTQGVQIWLTEAVMNMQTLTIGYYASEFQSTPSTQKISLDSAYLYTDYSGDGTINGTYDADTGIFTLDGNTTDELVMYIDPYTDYEESIFGKEPIYDTNGTVTGYAQKFIVAKYSMNARAILVPTGENADTKTQVLPSFISDATSQNPLYSGLSAEQKSYRYITSGKDSNGYTSDNRLRYGAEATAMQVLIIPCGGDDVPVVATALPEKNGVVQYEYTWSPDFNGNLLYSFDNPSAITIPHSMAGDDIQLAIGSVDEAGNVTYSSDELSQLNGYLGSYVYIDTFALTVREQQYTTDQILNKDDAGTIQTADSTAIFSGGIRENSDYLQTMAGTGSQGIGSSIDTSDSGNAAPLSESEGEGDMFDMDLGVSLPEMDLALFADYITIVMDGQRVGVSVGIPLAGYEKTGSKSSSDDTWTAAEGEGKNPKTFAVDAFNAVANFKTSDKSYTDAQSAKASRAPGATEPKGIESQSFSVTLSIQFALMFTYNNMTGSYVFESFNVGVCGSLTYRYQYRFVSVPILYLYFQFDGSIYAGVGIGVDYVEQSLGYTVSPNYTGTSTNYAYNTSLAKGETLDFSTNGYDGDAGAGDFRAFNITFNGKLYLSSTDSSIRTGVIESDGSTPTTIVLTKDPEDIPNCAISLKATDTTTITKIDPVKEPISRAYFTGVELTPTVGIELGGGIGIEVVKAELFVNAGLTATFALGGYSRGADGYSESYDSWVKAFGFNVGLGLRVVVFSVLNLQVDLVSYNIGYAQETAASTGEWSYEGSAFNGLLTFSETGDTAYVKSSLIANPSDRQTVYAPNNDNITAFAYQPTDSTNVPFEYAGYSGSGDAFRLVDGVETGYDYQVVTTDDGRNFVVYTLGREGTDKATESMMLVLSEILVTNQDGKNSYGLVHPNDYTNQTATEDYIVIDTDDTGDLGFHAWAEGKEINVAWVSYTADAVTLETPDGTPEDITAQTAKETVVKTATFDTAQTDVTTAPIIVSNNTPTASVSSPVGDGDALVYVEAVHYEDSVLDTMKTNHAAHLNELFAAYDGDAGFDDFVASSKELSTSIFTNLWNVSGASSKLNAVVNGTPVTTGLATTDQIITQLELVESQTPDTYYVAYTTQQFAYTSDHDMRTTTRLYLVDLNETTGFGTPKLLRTVVDSALDDSLDGVYTKTSTLTTPYQSPYIAQLTFLNGKIGDKLQNGEAAMMADTVPEDFLLFDMNGTTYILKNADMALLTDDNSDNDSTATLYPFFQSDDGSPTGRLDVTIGADSQGNVAAVYTSTVTGSLGNALYISAFDDTTGTWSDGTILAMRGLQIYEDSLDRDWTLEQLRYAYLYADSDTKNLLDGYTNDYGTLKQFTFSNMQIAMAANTSSITTQSDTATAAQIIGEDTLKRFGYDLDLGGAMVMSEALTEELNTLADALTTTQDGLLILTQGSMVQLVDNGLTYADDDGDNRVSVSPDYDHENTQTGIYAINFGFGQQKIEDESLLFANEAYTVSKQLNTYIAFTNTGDTAIRGSVANPITVELVLERESVTEHLATWTITDNIKSGALVNLAGITAALGSDVAEGDEFYFTVTENVEYLGANAYTYSSKGSDTGAIEIIDRAELAIEGLTVTPRTLNANGTVTAEVSFHVTNRGTKEADNIYVQFAYETGRDSDGYAVYAPFDLTGHALTATDARAIPDITTMAADNLENGVLNLSTISSSTGGNIAVNQFRYVTGTITVKPEHFAGIADELSLKVEVASDETASVQRMSDSVTITGHNEYNTLNNADTKAITHMTTFTAPSKIVLAMGNTTRIPVSAINSTGTSPVLVAMEAHDSADATPNLGICYYQDGVLVLVPSSEGSGKLNLTDTTTNQTYAIDFTVTGESDGINIFKDNEIFTFYNSQNAAYTEDAVGYDGWDFAQDAYWAYDTTTGNMVIPVNNDYSTADIDAYFTYQSVAEKIYLTFAGSVCVTSTFNADPQYLTSDGLAPVEIDFGNTTGATHTITVRATANDTRFDTVEEDFTSTGTPTPSEDKTAPQIFWSRSFPDTASVQTGNSITLTAYVLDDTGLASIQVNGAPPANITEHDSGYWSFELTISENGTYEVIARDTAGTSAKQTFTVDWFADTVSTGAIATAPTVSGTLHKNDGSELTTGTFLGDNETAYLQVTASGNVTTTTANSHVIVTDEGINGWATTELTVTDGKATVANNGYYEVYVETAIGTWARTFVKMSAMDSGTPVVVANFDARTSTLTFSATKEDDGGNAATLQSLSVNGQSLATDIDSYTYTGSYAITLDGAYSFIITDDAGKTSTLNVSVTDKFPVTATPALISNVDGAWNASLNNGSFVLNESAISGGQYDATASNIANGVYIPTYQYAVVNVEDDFTQAAVVTQAEDTLNGWLDTQTWTTMAVADAVTVDNLEAGTHAVYIRSVNGTLDAVRQEVTIADESLSITSVSSTDCTKNLQDGTITITATGGKDDTGRYQFAYTPLTITTAEDGITDTTVYLEAKDFTNWTYFDGATAVFTEVLNGDYQVAVRMAEGLTDTTAFDSANATYKTALATLEAFASKTEDGYAAALEAYETAKTALETQQAAIANLVDPVYTSDPTLWGNAVIDVVTVGLYTPPSTGASSYTSSLTAATNGTITLSGSRNTSGTTVTITAEPDDGYQVGDVTVTYSSGREVTVTDNGDGTYAYIQPGASVSVTVTFVPIADEVTLPFTDVAETAYYYDAIVWAVEHGVTNGITDTTFEPGTVCTRAQAVTFLWRANGSPTVSGTNPFTDLDSDKYYYEAVLWAVEHGITNGTTDTTFSPNDTCTRSQIVAFIWRMLEQAATDDNNPFTDVTSGKYYYEAVLWAVEHGITNGTTDTTFSPTNPCTRGHIVTFLYRNATNE